jgi:hypothetical protein
MRRDQLRLLDRVAVVTDGVGDVLHALLILHDGRIPLRHGVKVMAKEDSPRKRPSMARQRAWAVCSSTSMVRLRTESSTEHKI